MTEERILIIDDEPLIRLALADYLEEYGYETVTASDGLQGLIKARAEQFHVAQLCSCKRRRRPVA